jgi:hypothetical protein
MNQAKLRIFQSLIVAIVVARSLSANAQTPDSSSKLPVPQIAGDWYGGMLENIIEPPGFFRVTFAQKGKAIGGVWETEFADCDGLDLLESGTLGGSVVASQGTGLPRGRLGITLKIIESNSGQVHPCAITAVGTVTLDALGNATYINGTYRTCKHEMGTLNLQPGLGTKFGCF